VLGESHPKNANGTSDVLDSLLAAINELDVELAVDLLANAGGHANAARLRQCFEARSDVDAVPGNIVAVDDDVAEVDADAEFDSLVGSLRLVVGAHQALHLDRAAERRVRAAEFEQHPVTGGLDDPAAMFGDFGIDDALANFSQPRERSSVITFHVPAEADHVSDEDGGQPAANSTRIHGRLCDSQEWRGQTVTQGRAGLRGAGGFPFNRTATQRQPVLTERW